MLTIKSSMCMPTFAISVAGEYTKNEKVVADMNNHFFTIKCPNVFLRKWCQSGSRL